MNNNRDVIIIGGGFFGLNIALYLQERLGVKKILVLERESDCMQRASYNNQARIHGGYHYPRSLLTAHRSRINFPRFVSDFEEAIVNDFEKYYAVAKRFSKVSSRQFQQFCSLIGAEINAASRETKDIFNDQLVEDVFAVREYAFDAKKLKDLILRRINDAGIKLKTAANVIKITQPKAGLLEVWLDNGYSYHATSVFNCTYSAINKLNINSKLPAIPLKHELTETALVELPPKLKDLSVTVMCGPFFSFMPFPAKKGLHTLSHVRYTPHREWHDEQNSYHDGYDYLKAIKKTSHYPQIIADARRYIPALGESRHVSSLWEIKTILPQSEIDDSRPILFKDNHGLANYHCIVGGKIDNIYDVFKELDYLYD